MWMGNFENISIQLQQLQMVYSGSNNKVLLALQYHSFNTLDDKQFYKFVILFVARLLILCPLLSFTDIVL